MPNRNIRCVDCMETVWVNQKQWRGYLIRFGSPRKIKRNFRCGKCLSLEKNDIFKYQLFYGKPIKKIRTDIRKLFKKYKKDNNLQLLESGIIAIIDKQGLPSDSITYILGENGRTLNKIVVGNVPFINELPIPLYTPRKKSY